MLARVIIFLVHFFPVYLRNFSPQYALTRAEDYGLAVSIPNYSNPNLYVCPDFPA